MTAAAPITERQLQILRYQNQKLHSQVDCSMESRWSGAFLQQALPVCVPSYPMAATADMFPLRSSSDHMYVELTLRLQTHAHTHAPTGAERRQNHTRRKNHIREPGNKTELAGPGKLQRAGPNLTVSEYSGVAV